MRGNHGGSASRGPYHTGREDRMAPDDQRRREIVAALRGVALFRGLTDEELAGLAARVVRKRYARDEVIFGQGEPGRGLYIVARGHVGISRQGPQGTELLLTLA